MVLATVEGEPSATASAPRGSLQSTKSSRSLLQASQDSDRPAKMHQFDAIMSARNLMIVDQEDTDTEEEQESEKKPEDPPTLVSRQRHNSYSPVTTSSSVFQEGFVRILHHWKILLGGQVLSLLFSSYGAAQAGLYLNCNVSAPAFSMSWVFAALSAGFFFPSYIRNLRENRHSPIEHPTLTSEHEKKKPPTLFGVRLGVPAVVYFMVALMEVEANYMTLLAFQYTTLTSITLLDSLSVPSVMIVSRILLKRKYDKMHYIGAAVCLGGVLVNILGDYEYDVKASTDDEEWEPYPDKVVGDILAFAGAVMFGCLHVFQEVMVQDYGGPNEYLGLVGFFGYCIAGTQSLILERDEIRVLFAGEYCDNGLLLLFAFVVTKSLIYVGNAQFLLKSEAALLNLSLLTSDVWSALFSVAAENIIPPNLFWVALPITAAGIILYEIGPSPLGNEPADEHFPHVDDGASLSSRGTSTQWQQRGKDAQTLII